MTRRGRLSPRQPVTCVEAWCPRGRFPIRRREAVECEAVLRETRDELTRAEREAHVYSDHYEVPFGITTGPHHATSREHHAALERDGDDDWTARTHDHFFHRRIR